MSRTLATIAERCVPRPVWLAFKLHLLSSKKLLDNLKKLEKEKDTFISQMKSKKQKYMKV